MPIASRVPGQTLMAAWGADLAKEIATLIPSKTVKRVDETSAARRPPGALAMCASRRADSEQSG